MYSQVVVRRTIASLLVLVALVFALFWLFNVRGYRARIVARLLRTDNQPVVVPLPIYFQPQVPPGFNVSILADGFDQPRWLAVAPNGHVFLADSAAGKVIVLDSSPLPGGARSRETFADHLDLPFGIAFRDDYVYISNTNRVLRFRYDTKSSRRLGDAEPILDLPGLGYNQHWTRSLAFSPDGNEIF